MTMPFDPILNSRPRRLADLLKLPPSDNPAEPSRGVALSNGLGAPSVYNLDEVANAGVDHTPQVSQGRSDRSQRVRDVLRGVASGLSGLNEYEGGITPFLRAAGQSFGATSDTIQGLQEHRQDRDLEQQDRAAASQERLRLMLRQEEQDRVNRENITHDNARDDARDLYTRTRDAATDKRNAGQDKGQGWQLVTQPDGSVQRVNTRTGEHQPVSGVRAHVPRDPNPTQPRAVHIPKNLQFGMDANGYPVQETLRDYVTRLKAAGLSREQAAAYLQQQGLE